MLEGLSAGKPPYDMIIVGGGATGLGTAVDASNRGFRVLLVEQGDFGKGTSSRSTKLVHGGVRYLKQGNLSLVLHALKERGLMLRNAPHLVHDLEFMIPSYNWWEGPYYGVGLKAYDHLAGKYSFGRSRMVGRDEAVRKIPTIEADGLRGGVVYHDGQFDDSRLVINLAQTAVEAGADVLNYVKCVGLIKESGRVSGILARDTLSGEEYELSARVVVNATGVFVDELLNFDDRDHAPIVTVSQGIHFVLPGEFLPGNCALMVPKTADGRVLFAIPWHGCVVVGTTDIQVDQPSLEPVAMEEERDFVMSHACKYLSKDPSDSDVLSIFAGLRPLVRASGAKSTSKLSRDHTILVGNSGLVTVTGGKWTTYRKMAEDVVNMSIKSGGLEQKECATENLKIHGWTEETAPEDSMKVYGSDAAGVRNLCRTEPGMDALLHPELPYRKGEVIWHARNEMAMTVEDVLARRTRSLFLNARASIEAAGDTATLLAGELGHNEQWAQEQVEAFTSMARHYVYTDAASVLAPVNA
ncbi:MAG: glycerol-3-phosphate dehydrogenase/oxidase [Puniceicoccaceae bacterium]